MIISMVHFMQEDQGVTLMHSYDQIKKNKKNLRKA